MTTETLLNSSPTKSLSTWWKSFKSDDPSSMTNSPSRPALSRSYASAMEVPHQGVRNQVGSTADYYDSPIFGAPLRASLRYASVKILLTDNDGESFVYGRIPVVIAKCAVYLKQNARETEGIFRIPGSVRRIRVLQDLFNTPPEYGRTLQWDGFTVHDAANLLKRYLAMLPDPVVPADRYFSFREPIQQQRFAALRDYYGAIEANGGSAPADLQPCSAEVVQGALTVYEDLIFALPRSSRQLFLYLIDLISIFAAQSEQNRMTNYNLTAIFQPSVLTIPSHEMNPEEAQLSRTVLQFLAENSTQLLRHVQDRAIRHHEAQKRSGDVLDVADDGASDGPEDEWAIPSPHPEVPTLVVPSADNSSSGSSNSSVGLRRHSKSVSAAQPPALTLTEAAEPSSMFTFLRRQRSNRLQRTDTNSEEESSGSRSPPPGEDDDRKSRFRRSLMVLLPGSSQPPSLTGEERPEMRRSPSWFARLTEKRTDEE